MTEIGVFLIPALMWGASLDEQAILDGADARIEQYRTSVATLHLVDVEGKPLPAGTEVTIEQTRHAFLFGANLFKLKACKTPEDNAAYEKYFSELLNYATLPFYWWGYERKQGEPGHARIREMLDWCEAHGIQAKGHPLVWNWRDPAWLPDELDRVYELQMNRITREMNMFAGRLNLWDVVNEATQPYREGSRSASPKLTALIQREGVGPFVRAAFRQARQANPDALLVINDFDVSYPYIDTVLTELVDEHGRLMFDVIGIQSHMFGGPWPATMTWDTCERYSRFGRPIHFTETTLTSGERMGWGAEEQKKKEDPSWTWVTTPEGEQRQAEEVVRFYTILFSHPSVEAITWWDFTDQGAWRGAPSGFLRSDMTPKSAYHALKGLIKGKWWTTTRAEVDGDGGLTFRGFYGDYRVQARHSDHEITGRFRLATDMTAPIEVRMQ